MSGALTFNECVECFARGFSVARSIHGPFLPHRIGPAWLLHDDPRRKRGSRCSEWITHGVSAREAGEVARLRPEPRYGLCYLRTNDEPRESIRRAFIAEGYRLFSTEAFFIHELDVIPEPGPWPVGRVTQWEAAARLNAAAGRRQILREHLDPNNGALRQYVAWDGGTAVGWVRSLDGGPGRWCSNLFVQPEYRRRGIGLSLMAKMLADDRAAGDRANVLLASSAGARLYPQLGYKRIGELLFFRPKMGGASPSPRHP